MGQSNMSVQIRKRYSMTHMATERGGYGLIPSTRQTRASTHGYFIATDMHDYLV
jgi:hypothetical protein